VIQSLPTLSLEARTVPMGHLDLDPQHILPVAKRQCSTILTSVLTS